MCNKYYYYITITNNMGYAQAICYMLYAQVEIYHEWQALQSSFNKSSNIILVVLYLIMRLYHSKYTIMYTSLTSTIKCKKILF